MLRILILIVFCLISQYSTGQNYTISGYLTDKASGESLIGANVFDENSLKGTISNTYGFYSLTLASEDISLNYSYIGYKAEKFQFKLTKDTIINLALSSDLTLEEVEITATKNQEKIEEKVEMSAVELPITQITKIPALLGEPDVIKALQLLPGVQSGSEGSSGLYVRGGGPGQNLFLLDGVPVYNVQHLFGFFSVFDPNAIKSVKLYKGAFPARYGGRLSSVIDIRLKEGNLNEFKGNVGVGLIMSKFMLEGPIKKNKSSFMVSARRTYIDILAQPFIRASARRNDAGSSTTGYYFYDAIAKAQYILNDKNRLFLSFYGGQDRFYLRLDESYDQTNSEFSSNSGWGNLVGSARWNHQFTNKLFANTTATLSRFKLGNDIGLTAEETDQEIIYSEDISFGYLSNVIDLGLKTDFDYIPHPNHYIRFGGKYINHQFTPGVSQFQYSSVVDTFQINQIDTLFGNNKIFANETYLYAEDDWKISDKVKVNAGLHLSTFHVQKTNYISLQPRFSIRYKFAEKQSLKASFVTMSQNVHLLTNSSIDLPTDLWVPTTSQIKPETSWQAAVGWSGTFFKGIEFSAETYYKQTQNLVSYKEGANTIATDTPWEEKVTGVGNGESYGFEFLVQKKRGRFTGWLGYTLAWSWREFKSNDTELAINFGERFPFRYDRRHDLSIVGMYDITDRISLNVTWVFATGNAINLAQELSLGASKITEDDITFFGVPFEHYGGRNGFRAESYHRLDWALQFKKEKKRGTRIWTIGTYNTYNRRNPFAYRWVDNNSNRTLRRISLFPIIPAFNYSFSF